MDGFGRRETQTTRHSSDLLGPEKSGDKGTWRLDSGLIEWTDEKHNLYLKSMEASFVDQLYSSVDIPAWNSLKKNDATSSRQMHCAPSGQKLNFKNSDLQLNTTWKQSPSGLLENPWIRDFRFECKSKAVAPPNPPEMSDQNFIDEEISGEKGSSECSLRKKKLEKIDASSYDQKPKLRNAFFELDEDEECKWLQRTFRAKTIVLLTELKFRRASMHCWWKNYLQLPSPVFSIY